jgi:hypothetical protein
MPFVVVGVLTGFGVVVLSIIPFGMLLGWMNHALGLDARDQWEARVWFNSILTLVFNLAVAYIAMVLLGDALGKRSARRGASAG